MQTNISGGKMGGVATLNLSNHDLQQVSISVCTVMISD